MKTPGQIFYEVVGRLAWEIKLEIPWDCLREQDHDFYEGAAQQFLEQLAANQSEDQRIIDTKD